MENIDVNFDENLNREEILKKYKHVLQELREFAQREHQIHACYFDKYVMLQYLKPNATDIDHNILGLTKKARNICISYILLIFLCTLAYRQELHTSILYPGLRLWRHLTLPIITFFPNLTDLYDETCLLENPFYENLDCDSCAGVYSIVDLTDEIHEGNFQNHLNTPFIVKIEENPIELSDFYKIYKQNRKVFQSEAFRVSSTHGGIRNLEDLFYYYNETNKKEQQEMHSLWRCNRMLPARLVRSIFRRPKRLSRNDLALERFIAIDTAHADSYALPDTQCSTVQVQQALGTRIIILRPTSECSQQCRTLSVRLPQFHALIYNMWYWKAISTPEPLAENLSISLIGSHC